MQQLRPHTLVVGATCALASALFVVRPRAQDAASPSPPSAPAASARAQRAPIGVCRSAGRLACDQAPSSADPEALCAQLTACLENRRFSEGVVKDLILCEPLAAQVKLVDARGPAREQDDAGVRALAAVSAIVEDPEGRQFHAAYLVGAIDQGWCVLDELLDPLSSPNGCDATFRIAQRTASHEQPHQATVSAQRTCYDTRDQEELARGESNVRSVACAKVRYAVANGRVRRLEFSERDGSCTVTKAK